MVKALDARAVDNGSGGFLDLANAEAAFAEWQRYRDHAVPADGSDDREPT
jgi:hypothetical protein